MESSVIAAGIIETFAGNGKSRSTGDGKVATKAGMPLPVSVAVDPAGTYLYFAESGSDRVRRVELATSAMWPALARPATAETAVPPPRRGSTCRWAWRLIPTATSTSAIQGAAGSAGLR